MRNPTDVLNSLSDKSKNLMYKFERLYRNLYNPEFYLLAYKNIYANDGSMTPGVDGVTTDGMSLERIDKIIASLKDHSYRPNPARRTYTAKKNNPAKKRPLGIPSGDDKLVQEVVRMILESIYEPTFSDVSHGFRPGKSCHTALVKIQSTFTGAKWFVEGDIQACFDSFDHHVLIEILRRRIKDEAFIGLMWKFLKAGYMEQWKYHKTYTGTPQGAGISHILANIYLNELDKYMEEYKQKFSKSTRTVNPAHRNMASRIFHYKAKNDKFWNTLSAEEQKERARILRQMRAEQRNLPTHPFREVSYKSLQYVRYADDFLIGVVGSREDAERLKQDLAVFLKEKLGLTLSAEKTKITNTAQLLLGAALRFWNFSFVPLWGISQGFQPAAGTNYGAKDYDRVKKLTGVFITAATVLSLVFYIPAELFPDKILSMFLTTPGIAELGATNFRIMFSTYILQGSFLIAVTLFQSLGKANRATWLVLFRQIILFIPLCVLLPMVGGMGIRGVWLAIALTDAILVVITIAMMLSEFRKMPATSIVDK